MALQWPNPRILCYKTSYSDMPSNSLRSCCSLYSLNLGFTVFWLLVFAIMVIARDVVRIIICLCFWIVHVAVVVLFRCVASTCGCISALLPCLQLASYQQLAGQWPWLCRLSLPSECICWCLMLSRDGSMYVCYKQAQQLCKLDKMAASSC